MKLSNFQMIKVKGKNALDLEYFAEVDVTTGSLFWKKTERRLIHRRYALAWRFADTGKFTPEFQAEELENAYKARKSFQEP